MNDIKNRLMTKENVQAFRNVFSSEQGRKVLDIILVTGGFFDDEIRTPESVGARNLCTTILKFMGVSQIERSNEFVMAFTDSIANLTIEKKGDKK